MNTLPRTDGHFLPVEDWGPPLELSAFPWIRLTVYVGSFPRGWGRFGIQAGSGSFVLLLNPFMSSCLGIVAMCLAFGRERGRKVMVRGDEHKDFCPGGVRVHNELDKSYLAVNAVQV